MSRQRPAGFTAHEQGEAHALLVRVVARSCHVFLSLSILLSSRSVLATSFSASIAEKTTLPGCMSLPRRHEVLLAHCASNEEVLASGRPRQASVASSRNSGAVQVERDVLQLGPLELPDCGRIPRTHRIVDDVAEVGVSPRPDGHHVASSSPHPQGLIGGIPRDDLSRHAIDVVHILADIAGHVDLHPNVDWHSRWAQILLCLELGILIVVRIALDISINPSFRWMSREQSLECTFVYMGSSKSGASENRGLRMRLEEHPDVLHCRLCWWLPRRPRSEVLECVLFWLRGPQLRENAPELWILAAEGLMQFHPEGHSVPDGSMPNSKISETRHLPLVTHHHDRHTSVCGTPELVDPLEVPGLQL